MKRRTISMVLVACLLAGSTGCSWLFMTRLPRDYQPSQEPDCSDWYVWPVIDALSLASYLAMTIGIHTGGVMDTSSGGTSSFYFSSSLLITMIHFHSALGGFVWARECNRAIDEHERWLDEQARIRRTRSAEPAD